MAPEMIDGRYTEKSDIWSLGAVLYLLVSGYLPFSGKTSEEVFTKIKNNSVSFRHKEFQTVTPQCIDLIQKLLLKDPRKRLSAAEALKHPWFDSVRHKEDHEFSNEVLARFRSFHGVSKFKKAALHLLVQTLPLEEMKNLKEVFESMDQEGTGMIGAKAISHYLKTKHLPMSSQEIADLISEIDYYGDSQIHYSEFLAATIDTKRFFTDKKLQAIFH